MIIRMENALSYLEADTQVIAQVRRHVSYKALNLPPRGIKYQLDHYLGGLQQKRMRRRGYERDLEHLYRSPEGEKMLDAGWGPEKWTRSLFETAARQKGLWDGWTTLVKPDGTFGTGLIEHVQRALTLRMGLPRAKVLDHRKYIGIASDRFECRKPVLWQHQSEAVRAWGKSGYRGVIDLPPRTGKTRIAFAAIAELGVPTIIVAPRVEIVRQTVEKAIPIFGEGKVLAVTGGSSASTRKRELALLRAPIWVATPKTALSLKLESRGLLILDEFHHSAAKTYQEISIQCRYAYNRLGLTGTHFRADGKDLIMHSVLSRSVYKRSIPECVAMGRLVQARAALVRTTGEGAGLKVPDQAYRNAIIAWCARELARRGKRVLVLCMEVRHVEEIVKAIPGAVGVDGRDTKKGKVREALDALEARRIPCVVGTSVIGEGVDVPAADAMVYAAGNRSKVKVIQDVFRILTASAGKSHGVLIDLADNHDASGVRRAAERLHYYRTNGFDARPLDTSELPAWLDAAC